MLKIIVRRLFKRNWIFFGALLVFAQVASATSPLFIRNTTLESAFNFDVTTGILNGPAPLDSGVALSNRLGVRYAIPAYDPNPEYEMHIDFYFGGKIQDGEVNYGPGNLKFGGLWKFYEVQEAVTKHALTSSFEVMLPLAQSESSLGLATPDFVNYFEDAFGFQPGVSYLFSHGNWSITPQLLLDILLVTDDTASPVNTNDTAELMLETNIAAGYSFSKTISLNVEAAGIHSLTGEETNSEIWVGPSAALDVGGAVIKIGTLMPVNGDSQDVQRPLMRFAWSYLF